MENMPLVSVIMPTYNGEKYIEQSILSVFNQSYPNMELLVLDDASQDNTPNLLRYLKQRLDTKDQIRLILEKKNKWISGNMNIGIKEAKWKYIAVLDQDDVRIDPNKTAKQVDFLENNNDYWIVWTNVMVSDKGKEDIYKLPASDEYIRQVLLFKCPMLHSSVMYDRAIAQSIWWYALKYKYAMDYNLFLDFMKVSKWDNLPDITTLYRKHWNNTSLKYKKQQALEAHKILKSNWDFFSNKTKGVILRSSYDLFHVIFGDSDIWKKIKKVIVPIILKT